MSAACLATVQMLFSLFLCLAAILPATFPCVSQTLFFILPLLLLYSLYNIIQSAMLTQPKQDLSGPLTD